MKKMKEIDGRKEKEWVDRVVYIILLGCINKNWDVGCIVGWVDKINNVVFEDIK